MTRPITSAAAFPGLVSTALRPLPLGPIQLFLSAVLRRIVRHHPHMFERLGSYAGKRYGLDPSDLPFAFILDTAPQILGSGSCVRCLMAWMPGSPVRSWL